MNGSKEFQKSDFGRDFLPDIVEWIASNMAPDEVFDPDDLEEWAEEHRSTVQLCTACSGELGGEDE